MKCEIVGLRLLKGDRNWYPKQHIAGCSRIPLKVGWCLVSVVNLCQKPAEADENVN